MEFDLLDYSVPYALRSWGNLVVSIAVVALGVGLLSCLRLGPSGIAVFKRGIFSYFRDILSMSPTRVLAIARLTLKEAIRRKMLMVFVIFAVLLMFGGWFLSSGNSRQELQTGVQIWFLLTAISWLVLPAVMFLACWSIPEDIRVRSLHTVVTKPIRRIEVVLGRIVGFGAVVTSVVLVMGIAGYIWIQRQIPDSAQDGLTCRVPKYGNLYFKDREGQLAESGVNTGDIWAYRSYIEGNSRARAVWVFRDIDADQFGDDQAINLESRFEAFRLVKGSVDSVEQGLEGQYTLVNNRRADAFGLFGNAVGFREFGAALLEGQFGSASTILKETAASMTDGSQTLTENDCMTFSVAAKIAGDVVTFVDDEFSELGDAFYAASRAAGLASQRLEDEAAFSNWSETCLKLADKLSEQSDRLMGAMPRIEVPLPTFNVTEYHEGQDKYTIPRKLTFTAEYESLSRYLSATVTAWNEQNKLVSGDALADSLVASLAESTDLSALNSELLVEVLQEEIVAEALAIRDGQLVVSDGQSWYSYFDQLLRAERLVSQDPAGWVLTADLYDDLVVNGLLKVEVACLDREMFIGMARPDLFIRMSDNPFYVGYSKALFSTVLMLLLVVVIGVTASCVVKGPVALFLTFGVFLIGQTFHGFMSDILTGQVVGGGLVESAVSIVQQRSPEVGVDATRETQNMIASLDKASTALLQGAYQVIPDFAMFSRSAMYIENGFDVPWNTSMVPTILTFVGFLIPCVLLAAAFLKFRELESK
jgi:ABC-type transport system involved in multi-copper enzyme maturation permease subunit